MTKAVKKITKTKNKKSEKLTDLEIEQGSDKVMFPELHTALVRFMDQEITLKPLPIRLTKQLNVLIRPVMVDFVKASKLSESDTEALISDNPLDDLAVSSMISATNILLKFYNIPSSEEQLEDYVTVESLYQFLGAQMELNGKNDFLLRPLRMLLKVVEASVAVEDDL